MEITYEKIKPIIKSQSLNGQRIDVSFQADNQDTPIQAVGMMIADQSEIAKKTVKSAVKQSVFIAALSSVGRFLGGLIGGSGGRIAGTAASTIGGTIIASKTSDPNQLITVKDTPENREKAILKAFESVMGFYNYNTEINSWEYITPKPPTNA